MTPSTRPRWYSLVWFGPCPREWRQRPTHSTSLERLIKLATDVYLPPTTVRIVECPTRSAAVEAGIDGSHKVVWSR